ncbi:hypothetical protein [Riemerella anatipestifer]|uniref:Phage protein D n=1 Tax=Riemerella anatipestifer TaxID=34085 RepID=A0A1S7DV31_RIEAN|nr:hypothetical protein [Riemerella anatipestifer]AQY22974.1 phage protein D [Riemerella anatipestifer]MCO7355771.1 hypothetical protein [Riemerella anatipestifer]MDY3351863.1 hypothetical protein [Riemerella anatipestifer]
MRCLYFNINLRIGISDKIQFTKSESITIKSSVETFTDTATIKLPREFKQATKKGESFSIAGKRLLDIIQVGDAIKIEAGYNGNYSLEFEGYITKIGAEVPIILDCEDEMWKMKKTKPIKRLYSSVGLKKLLQDLAPGYEVKVIDDIPLGKFAINNSTPYKVFEYLKQNYGIRCFFKGKVLHAGMPINLKPENKHIFNLNRNVRKGGDLVYETKEGRKCWVKAISKQKGTSKQVIYEFGEQGENEITLHGPVGLNKEALKKWAESYYNSMIYDGYSGSFDSWGDPQTKAGDSAEIIDPNYPDKHRDGIFYISEVVIDINANDGFKRKNTITFKIKDNAIN